MPQARAGARHTYAIPTASPGSASAFRALAGLLHVPIQGPLRTPAIRPERPRVPSPTPRYNVPVIKLSQE